MKSQNAYSGQYYATMNVCCPLLKARSRDGADAGEAYFSSHVDKEFN
jgi:hypothetical protein